VRPDAQEVLPRYLYRVYSSASPGSNSPTRMSPIASTWCQHSVSLEDMRPRMVRDMLEKHLQRIPDCEDQFTSWTSSLLCALHHAIYDTARQDEVRVCIIDTLTLDNAPFYHAAALFKLYGISPRENLQHEYFTAEYLSTGTIHIGEAGSTTIRFSDLVNGGLYDLVPHLRPKPERLPLCEAAAQFKRTHFRIPAEMSQCEIDIAKSLAQSVPGARGLALFIGLLSLQERKVSDQLFLKAIRKSYFCE
jgi:hypothetical protein